MVLVVRFCDFRSAGFLDVGFLECWVFGIFGLGFAGFYRGLVLWCWVFEMLVFLGVGVLLVVCFECYFWFWVMGCLVFGRLCFGGIGVLCVGVLLRWIFGMLDF